MQRVVPVIIFLVVIVLTQVSCSESVSVDVDTVQGSVALCGGGVDKVTLTLHNDEHGTVTVETDDLGEYRFTDVWPGTYTVTPHLEGYTFTPATRTVTISGTGVVDQDFATMTSWSVRYHEGVQSKVFDIHQTSDCGYILCGTIDRSGALGLEEAENMDMWVARIDKFGQMEWEWIDGGVYGDAAYSVTPVADGSYVVAGRSYDVFTEYDVRMVRLSDGPVVEWEQQYRGNEADQAQRVRLVSNGELLLAGSTSSESAGMHDFLLMTAPVETGVLSAPIRYGVADDEKVYDMNEVYTALGASEGYLMVGYRHGLLDTHYALALKVNDSYVEDWSREYRALESTGVPNEITIAYSFSESGENGYIIAGETQVDRTASPDAWVARINNDGSLDWEQVFDRGLSDSARTVFHTSDNGCVVGGFTTEDAPEFGDYWLVKCNAEGAVQWEKTWSGLYEGDDRVTTVLQTYDGGFLLSGNTQASDLSYHPWLIKLDRNAEIAGGTE